MMEDAPPSYHVTLDVFEGPIDLLLRLIEREELDISQVSLALVADQYLASIARLREVSAENLADFLVIAAKLLLIKSRHLLPRSPEPEEAEEEEDVGEALARQLQEYKRFKEVATQLRAWEDAARRMYARAAPPPQIEKRLEPGQVTPQELLEALHRALIAHPQVPPVDNVVSPVVVRIADCIGRIQSLLSLHGRVYFGSLMRQARSRTEILVTFIAILELIKQQRIRATQERAFGEILLEARQSDPGTELPPMDLRDYGEGEEDQATGESIAGSEDADGPGISDVSPHVNGPDPGSTP